MKKYSWILALLLALTLAFVFTGCSSSGDDDDDDDTTKAGYTETELTLVAVASEESGNKTYKIEGEEFAAIKAANKFSYLAITFLPKHDYGSGALGSLKDAAGKTPSAMNLQIMGAAVNKKQTTNILVSDILPYVAEGDDFLYLNFFNEADCQAITLYAADEGLEAANEEFGLKYATEGATKVLPPPGGKPKGKGDIPGLATKAILAAADTAKLVLYLDPKGKTGYGVGKFEVKEGAPGWGTKEISVITSTSADVGTKVEIPVGDIKTAHNGDDKAVGLSINMYESYELLYMEIQP